MQLAGFVPAFCRAVNGYFARFDSGGRSFWHPVAICCTVNFCAFMRSAAVSGKKWRFVCVSASGTRLEKKRIQRSGDRVRIATAQDKQCRQKLCLRFGAGVPPNKNRSRPERLPNPAKNRKNNRYILQIKKNNGLFVEP